MDHVVTISSRPAQGGLIEISIEISGPDTALATIRTWPRATPVQGDRPKVEVQHLFDGRIGDNGTRITCRATAPGANPVVTFTLNAGSGAAARSVTVAIVGTILHIGDRTTTYPLPDADYQALLAFVASSGFPKA